MFGVYASDVETLREVLDRPYRLLGAPFCGYLIYLARSVDKSALDFLDNFGAAIDHETGESLAFIVLLDDTTLSYCPDPLKRRAVSRSSYGGNYAGWPRYRQNLRLRSNHRDLNPLDVPELVDGNSAFENAVAWRIRGGSTPKAASYRSSPEWSLKFADHLGLNRKYLPCIVAFDDPESSKNESCVVIPLEDPAAAWDCIVDAVSNFVLRPATQAFIHASEQSRKAASDLQFANHNMNSSEYELTRLRSSGNQRIIADKADRLSSSEVARWEASIPSQQKFLKWIDLLPNDRRSFIAEAALVAQNDGEDVTPLLRVLEAPAAIRTTRQYLQTVYELRTLWLKEFQGNPHVTAKIHAQLATALVWLERPAEDLGRVLVMGVAEREMFISSLEANAPFQQSDLQLARAILKETLGQHVKKAVVDRKIKDLQAETDKRISYLEAQIEVAHRQMPYLTDRRRSAMAELSSTKRCSFLPDLAQSVEQMAQYEDVPVCTVSSARKKIVKSATITAESTGFIASIIQILQGIGVLK